MALKCSMLQTLVKKPSLHCESAMVTFFYEGLGDYPSHRELLKYNLLTGTSTVLRPSEIQRKQRKHIDRRGNQCFRLIVEMVYCAQSTRRGLEDPKGHCSCGRACILLVLSKTTRLSRLVNSVGGKRITKKRPLSVPTANEPP